MATIEERVQRLADRYNQKKRRTKAEIAKDILNSDPRVQHVGIPERDHDAEGYEIDLTPGYRFAEDEHIGLFARASDFTLSLIEPCDCKRCQWELDT